MRTLILLGIAALLFSQSAHAGDLTAFEAIALAKKEVNKIARKSLVEVEGSEDSPGILPTEWRVLFYDPYASQHGTMVRVAGNTIVEITDGYTQMKKFRMAAYKQEEIIEPDQLKVDSSKLLKILKGVQDLNGIKLSSLGLWLKKEEKGPLAPPIWHVTLYALRKGDGKEVKIGTAQIHGQSGEILETRIYPKRVEAEKG